MAWTDEITEAAYTSPSGKRIVFNFSPSVNRKTPLKTAEHTFPDVDGAEVQSLGLGGKKFPMTAIFDGADCMKNASEFEEALCERGFGFLEHPIYGKHAVVPTGEIERTDDLVSSLNESKVVVTFAETITDKAFPESEVAAIDELESAIDKFDTTAAETFAELIETDSIDDSMQLQSVLKIQSNSLFEGISKLASKSSNLKDKMKVLQKINELKNKAQGIISSVDKIAANAQELAATLIQTARMPAALVTDVLAKIEGYATIVDSIVKNVKKDPFGNKAIKNQYAATSMILGSLVASCGFGVAQTASAAGSGASGASAEGGSTTGSFKSRAAVLNAAESVTELFETYKTYMDSQIAKDAFVDSGEGYSALLQTIASSVQVMQEAAFNLPMTRIVKLGRDRQVIELLAELYGAEGFYRIDEFINDNHLNADEIVLIPMGREVHYYV